MKKSARILPVQKKHVDIQEKVRTDLVINSLITSKFKKSKTPTLIAIGGPGGCGKTTFAHRLRKSLKDSAVLSLDNYKTSRRSRNERNIFGPHPDANMIGLIEQHLTLLKNGQTISAPLYDRSTGDTGSFTEFVPEKYVIVEGEISTYPEFHHLFDLSVFIDADLKTQLTSRVERDIEQYGFSYEKAVTVFLNSNLKEFVQYGAESKNWSDITCYCHNDYEIDLTAVSEELFPLLQSLTSHLNLISMEGMIVPVLTPFTEKNTVDQQSFIRHLEWLYMNGAKKILVGGTTGEFFSLTIEERVRICSLACRYFPGAILFQIGCDGIGNTITLLERSLRYGIDGVFCLPPFYYSNAPERGLIEYFSLIASKCTVPLYLYNFPSHTGNRITREILEQVPHCGLKDSSDSIELSAYTPQYFTGNEKLIIETYRQGGKGFICGLPNIAPKACLGLESTLSTSNYTQSETILRQILSNKPSIPGISGTALFKALLGSIIDGYPPNVRMPLQQADKHKEFAAVKKKFCLT